MSQINMDFGEVNVSAVNRFHPTYALVQEDWHRMQILYEGGVAIKKAAEQFLVRRPKELGEIYSARIERFSYHNILGTCFGWYHASLFKSPPIISMKQMKADGTLDGDLPDKDVSFYNEFRKNCDRKGSSLIELTRDLWTNLALYSAGWVLIDLPTSDVAPDSFGAQKQLGLLDKSGKKTPHLVSYTPLDVINWGVDQYGVLTWAVLRIEEIREEFLGKSTTVDCWIYFDRKGFKRYERVRKPDEQFVDKVDGSAPVELVLQGPHALSANSIVPLMNFDVPSSLWLADRAYLPIVDHLNADNEFGWALKMSCLAMPVIITDSDVSPTLTEAGYIKLPVGSSYEWTESEGKSFGQMSKRVSELREECFRLMYLIYQGRTSSATADGTSGASKEMDMMPAQDVMNEFGEVIVNATQRLLDMVALARADSNVKADVRGMKFGKTATLEQIQKTEAVLSLGIPSDTFVKEVQTQAANEFLPDANPETMVVITKEIRSSPSMVEILQQQQVQRMTQFSNSVKGSTSQFATPPATPVSTTKPVSPRTSRVVNA